MKDYLRFKAGPDILPLVRDEGLAPRRVRVFAGPAGGPKWFVSVGFDRGLMQSHFFEKAQGRVLLAGSSAGAWRCLAMMCRDPLTAHEKLRMAYSRNVFTTADTPETIGDALRKNVEAFVDEEDVPFILHHPVHDLFMHTVRSRGPAASERAGVQGAALLVAAAMNVFSSHAMRLMFQRVAFYAAPEEPACLNHGFDGASARLTAENLRMAAVATGSLPYIIAGVSHIPAAPLGVYRDGGLLDYQLNQDYHPGNGGLILFFHYQERIVPGWFDKKLPWRKPPSGSLNRVLQVFPGPDFLKLLPDGRLPDRKDFETFVNNPSERFRRWDEVSRLSGILWEEFIESVESKAIRQLVRPL
ncbi:MAG: hypothetical protein HY914_08650 [Desulfomonile tiedjei]|nr:hypothetical protein [Desulfomonile tiedjei]